MSCEICRRGACTRSFHSIEEQEEFDAIKASAAILVRNGWDEDEAIKRVRQDLTDAAEEDGYDGP